MSLEEGKLYIPTLGNDGVWQLTSRGDSGTLGKKFALMHDEDLSETVDYEFPEISTASLASSISMHKMSHSMSEKPGPNSLDIPKFDDVHDPCDIMEMDLPRQQRSTVGIRPRRYVNDGAV